MNLLKPLAQKVIKRLSFPENNPEQDIPIFDQKFYQDITEARLEHLETLGLPLKGKKVIDVGCGIGRFSEFFVSKGCEVFCIDGREENIKYLNQIYPDINSAVVDLETEEIIQLGEFDVVFCYGLLYHLVDPMGFIRKAQLICRETIIIETCILDAREPMLLLVEEDGDNATQALHSLGCRPTPEYIIRSLKMNGFKYIYKPVTLPNHPQFRYKKAGDYSYQKKGQLIRDIFIGSKIKIENNTGLFQC